MYRAPRSRGDAQAIIESEPTQVAVMLLKELLSEDDGFLHAVVQPYLQQVVEHEILAASDPAQRPAFRSLRSARPVRIPVGRVTLSVPRHQRAWVLTRLLRRYRQAERTVAADLVELYLLGVSAARLQALTEGLCGRALSAAELGALQHRVQDIIARFAAHRRREACSAAVAAPRETTAARRR